MRVLHMLGLVKVEMDWVAYVIGNGDSGKIRKERNEDDKISANSFIDDDHLMTS